MHTPAHATAGKRRIAVLVSAVSLIALAVGVGAATGKQAGGIPAPIVNPSVSGLYVGQTLTASAGTWSSDTPVTTSIQWVRVLPDGGRQPIAGATGPTYTVGSADLGSRVLIQVKAQNATGPNWVNSDGSAIVVGPKTTSLAGGQTGVAAADVVLPDRLVVKSVSLAPATLKAGQTATAQVVVAATSSAVPPCA
jgi:hypothetical protein